MPDPTRLRVYRLLAEGHAMAKVASRLGIHRSTVLKHKNALEKHGAIRHAGGSSPILYERGPRAAEFEADMAAVALDRGGRSRRCPPTPQMKVRVHRGGFMWKVRSGPQVAPAWEKDWAASSVRCSEGAFTFDGRRYRVRETRGRRSTSLLFEPEEEWVDGSVDLQDVRRSRHARAARAVRAFAKRYGYDLVGRLYSAQPDEFALPVSDMGPVGVPGESEAWIDHSPGADQAELETQKAEAMQAFLDAPVRFARLEADVGLALRLLGQLGPMVVKITEVVQQLAVNQAQLLERMVTPPADPAAPEVA